MRLEREWTQQLSVGNAVIDADHKELFGLVSNIDCVTKAKDHFALPRALKLLNASMSRHFLNEELLAHALGTPFAMHKVAHQNMLAELDLTRLQIGKNSVVAIYIMEHYAQFLSDWLIKHIAEEDMQLKPVLHNHPYDFKINGVCL